ncbi:MAG TPA: S8 family serine peptidase [Gaiellaceae bacterium]|nr:S8 family serine peptidase [Gaiellaceae bacterium]
MSVKSLPLLVVLCAVMVAVPAAFSRTAPPSRVVVAVVDTGVTPTKQLAPRLVPGWNFLDGNANTADLNGHGTEIASIVASSCGSCFIEPVRVSGGVGGADLAIQGIAWAVKHGASVINLSMTTPADNPALSQAIEGAVADGITVVVAAGNSGQPVGYPAATAPDAISVASVDPTGKLYSWSNYGPWVTLTAPGVLPATNALGKTVTAVGTSASAGYVSGAAARLLACAPKLAPSAVRLRLQQSLAGSNC